MNDDADKVGYWVLAMPLAVAAFAGCAFAALEAHHDDLFRTDCALLVLTVAAWVRFRRLERLSRRP